MVSASGRLEVVCAATPRLPHIAPRGLRDKIPPPPGPPEAPPAGPQPAEKVVSYFFLASRRSDRNHLFFCTSGEFYHAAQRFISCGERTGARQTAGTIRHTCPHCTLCTFPHFPSRMMCGLADGLTPCPRRWAWHYTECSPRAMLSMVQKTKICLGRCVGVDDWSGRA